MLRFQATLIFMYKLLILQTLRRSWYLVSLCIGLRRYDERGNWWPSSFWQLSNIGWLSPTSDNALWACSMFWQYLKLKLNMSFMKRVGFTSRWPFLSIYKSVNVNSMNKMWNTLADGTRAAGILFLLSWYHQPKYFTFTMMEYCHF